MTPYIVRSPGQEWKDHAGCRPGADVDPEVFFAGDVMSRREAYMACLACPVRQPCLDDERANGGAEYGIRAGLPVKARRGARVAPTAEQITAHIAATRTSKPAPPDTATEPATDTPASTRAPARSFQCECGRTFGTFGRMSACADAHRAERRKAYHAEYHRQNRARINESERQRKAARRAEEARAHNMPWLYPEVAS